MKKIIIAIDGPAGSGKSSSAKIIAEKLNYIYIDTGAMYRAITLAWLQAGLELTPENLHTISDQSKIELKQSIDGQKTFLNGVDVSDAIRTPDVTKFVSPVSADAYVRELMVAQQREMGKSGGVVMDGRDIGTVVFPNAELKIYLIASIQARAERRYLEMTKKGMEVTISEVEKLISDRDLYDSSRNISPLKKAEDAIEIDTSNLTIIEQTNKVIDLANKIILD
ncbi:MAG TPA: (d)CMP kinase [Candidatus Kapabacteria bacterium]|nr:(d)CMP kinase [Candidatus Kapabacteria bacterium]